MEKGSKKLSTYAGIVIDISIVLDSTDFEILKKLATLRNYYWQWQQHRPRLFLAAAQSIVNSAASRKWINIDIDIDNDGGFNCVDKEKIY